MSAHAMEGVCGMRLQVLLSPSISFRACAYGFPTELEPCGARGGGAEPAAQPAARRGHHASAGVGAVGMGTSLSVRCDCLMQMGL
jgi:hypothetical protein